MLKTRALSIFLIIVMCFGLFYSAIAESDDIPMTHISLYEYCEGFSDNDRAVAVGVFFSSIGMWTGDISSESGMKRFASYIKSDLQSIVYKGSSIWSKLVVNGFDEEKLKVLIKDYTELNLVIRQINAISDTLDEIKINELLNQSGYNIKVYPENKKFTGRNVALTLLLFKSFNMPVLKYSGVFSVYPDNVDSLEFAKELFVTDEALAAKISYLDASSNLSRELNKLTSIQKAREFEMLIKYNIAVVAGSVTPTITPVESYSPKPTITPGPVSSPMPTPKFSYITKDINKLCSEKKISDNDVDKIIKNISLLKTQTVKWHNLSQQNAEKCLIATNYSLIYVEKALDKVLIKNKLKLFSKLGELVDYQRLVIENSMQVQTLIFRIQRMIKFSGRCQTKIKPKLQSEKEIITLFNRKLSRLVGITVKYASKNLFEATKKEDEFILTLDKSKMVQLQAATAQSVQVASVFKNEFKKADISIESFTSQFKSTNKYCMVFINQILPGKVIRLNFDLNVMKKLKSEKDLLMIINTNVFQIEFSASNLSSKKKGSLNIKLNNKNNKLLIQSIFSNIINENTSLSVKYNNIGDEKKPLVIYKNSKKYNTKISYDELLKVAKIKL